MFYQPLGADGANGDALLLRPAADARVDAGTLRAVLREIEPGLRFVQLERLGAALDDEIRPWRLGASIFTAFGLLAALLAAVGLYSALAYAITQRTREIGIRMAIGATARDVVGLVVRDGLRVAMVGIVIGLAGALLGGRWVADLLFGVSPRDWRVLSAVAASLMMVALLAAWGPARRAMRVSPTVAMRAE
jgi:ABC-type antimicrobial peptide transport system permease subunit